MSQQTVEQTASSPCGRRASDVLMKLWEQREFSDLTIICNGSRFKVHKAVVCSQSPVLRAACAGNFKEAQSGEYKMIDDSKLIVEKLLEYFYVGDYTGLSQDDDSACPKVSALQLHARVFALADKYDVQSLCDLSAEKYSSRLQDRFDVVEFLYSIPDVYNLTPPPVERLRIIVLFSARKRLENALQDSSHSQIYDSITSQVPAFTKDLLRSYLAPVRADCGKCGPNSPMLVLQVKCHKCGQQKGY